MQKLKQGAQKLGIEIPAHQLEIFEVYYRELMDWNGRINLTSITEYDDVQIKHFLDSLTLIPYLDCTRSISIIDVGTGGGFPGIPLKIVRPDIELTLVESTAKKIGFLNHLIRVLNLDRTEAVLGRAEERASEVKLRGQYDISVTRAVGHLSTNLEITLPFCKIGGFSISYKKGNIWKELYRAKQAAPILGGRFDRITYMTPDIIPDEHMLVFFEKVAHTQKKYPRKPGLPSKRPL
jgi:16S rRNA (guanine527-N7)-methyltransferase